MQELIKEENYLLYDERYQVSFEYYEYYIKYQVIEISGLDSEILLEGRAKWDSCFDIDFGNIHFCGFSCFIEMFKILEFIHNKAKVHFETIGNDNDMYWEWDFDKCKESIKITKC